MYSELVPSGLHLFRKNTHQLRPVTLSDYLATSLDGAEHHVAGRWRCYLVCGYTAHASVARSTFEDIFKLKLVHVTE